MDGGLGDLEVNNTSNKKREVKISSTRSDKPKVNEGHKLQLCKIEAGTSFHSVHFEAEKERKMNGKDRDRSFSEVGDTLR